MKMPNAIPETMLAPCGVNCAVCYVFLKKKKPCLGCHGGDTSKPEHCRTCEIKACATAQGVDFCFNCPTYPCAIIKRLDKSYKQRYQVSLIENAATIQAVGAQAFLLTEQAKWSCPVCEGVVALHDRICSECGQVVAPE